MVRKPSLIPDVVDVRFCIKGQHFHPTFFKPTSPVQLHIEIQAVLYWRLKVSRGVPLSLRTIFNLFSAV